MSPPLGKQVICHKCQKPVDAWLSTYKKDKVGQVTIVATCHGARVKKTVWVRDYEKTDKYVLFREKNE